MYISCSGSSADFIQFYSHFTPNLDSPKYKFENRPKSAHRIKTIVTSQDYDSLTCHKNT